jgi:hypothetical protein
MDEIEKGVAEATDAENGPGYARQKADVKRWFARIDRVRTYDEAARKQYALDRRYARGDSGFEVDDNILGTFIDILVAFLYAQDPSVDVLPAEAMEPPSMDALRDAAEDIAAQAPEIEQQAQMAGQAAQLAGMDPLMAMKQARALLVEQAIQAKFQEMQARYRKRQRDNKAFAETVELVVTRLWKDGKLKARARKMVRSALTIGVGWLKASWQERTAEDPQVLHKIADLRENVNKVIAKRQEIEEGDKSGDDLEAMQADYERQLKALEGEVERVIARGFAIDFVPAENITVADGCDLSDYLDAPWIAHRVPMPIDDIVAEFGLDDRKKKKLTRYFPRKPEVKRNESPILDDHVDAKDADAFTEGDSGAGENAVEYGMVEEIWDRDTNTVLTGARGLDCWLKDGYAPNATSRFYPLFLLALGEVDGQRHPQSYVTRSMKLVDQYNRMASQEAEHRRRVKPKTLFLRGQVGGDDMVKVETGATGEYVGVQVTNPQLGLSNLFYPLPYPQLDPALYDRSRIVQALERLWGIQEALSQAISNVKTATEAEIQQTGFQARTGSQRDVLEDMLTDFAQYTAEVALQNMDGDDARAMVGDDAMWPEWQGPESLTGLVNIEVRAGSSGKPNTSAEREAWGALLPMFQQSIQAIATLRGSDPLDVADSHEELLRLTVERSGDRMDIDHIVPQVGNTPMPVDPNAEPAPQGAPVQEPT